MRVMSALRGWLNLSDYQYAKSQATRKIVARLARGNVAMQHGWYLTRDDLKKLTTEGDAAMERLARRQLD
jgi:hypothetical protein